MVVEVLVKESNLITREFLQDTFVWPVTWDQLVSRSRISYLRGQKVIFILKWGTQIEHIWESTGNIWVWNKAKTRATERVAIMWFQFWVRFYTLEFYSSCISRDEVQNYMCILWSLVLQNKWLNNILEFESSLEKESIESNMFGSTGCILTRELRWYIE